MTHFNQLLRIACTAFTLFAIANLLIIVLPALLVGSAPSLPSSMTTISIPEHYYTNDHNPRLTFENLNDTIHKAVMPHEYERDVWDCSEGSAWMEWYLENKGFDVSIVTNRFPTGNHAYVKVQLPDGGVDLINCNSGSIHYYSNSSYYLYIHYDKEFVDIYDACNYSCSEFDWWNM